MWASRRSIVGALLSTLGTGGLARFDVYSDSQAIHEPTKTLKGFNLDYFYKASAFKPPKIGDLEFIAMHGFNAVRLPFDYNLLYALVKDQYIEMPALAALDYFIEACHVGGIHVVLAMHRAPGYCVNPPYEPTSLWRSKVAQDKFVSIWEALSRRYANAGTSLSFNLLNEPPDESTGDTYCELMTRCSHAIRAISPNRDLMLDGIHWGSRFPSGCSITNGTTLGARGYFPMQFTHFGATWIPKKYVSIAAPWPYSDGNIHIDKDVLLEYFSTNWSQAISKEIGVCIGEWGVFNRTAHKDALLFMADCLTIWRKLNWGWMLWNLRGPFGVLDSGRSDVPYSATSFGLLDTAMLRLLKDDVGG